MNRKHLIEKKVYIPKMNVFGVIKDTRDIEEENPYSYYPGQEAYTVEVELTVELEDKSIKKLQLQEVKSKEHFARKIKELRKELRSLEEIYYKL